MNDRKIFERVSEKLRNHPDRRAAEAVQYFQLTRLGAPAVSRLTGVSIERIMSTAQQVGTEVGQEV